MRPVEPSKVHRLFYPAVPVIVSCGEGGAVYAMPAVSVVSLSDDPPLVGVSSSPSHATHQAVLRVGRFSLSWVDASQVKALEVLGTTGHGVPDKLRAAGLGHSRGRKLGVPVVDGASASLECSLDARQPLGDHELLIGRVHEARATEDFRGYWRFESYRPVLYAGIQGGSFRTYRPRRAGVRRAAKRGTLAR
jgi:flavin reductase (DIM6/NTAB) family NADH-FMN oxidoreductase RutF